MLLRLYFHWRIFIGECYYFHNWRMLFHYSANNLLHSEYSILHHISQSNWAQAPRLFSLLCTCRVCTAWAVAGATCAMCWVTNWNIVPAFLNIRGPMAQAVNRWSRSKRAAQFVVREARASIVWRCWTFRGLGSVAYQLIAKQSQVPLFSVAKRAARQGPIVGNLPVVPSRAPTSAKYIFIYFGLRVGKGSGAHI